MLQLFIVFHKKIFDECYKNIPADILYSYFTFISVNEKIPKEYTAKKYKIINEWEMPIYDPTFQERGYNENSAIYHVYANNLHAPYKYVGFFQYDMEFQDNIVEFIQNNIQDTLYYFSLDLYNFEFCYQTWGEEKTCTILLNDYQQFFSKPFAFERGFPLCNTYVLPTDTFIKIMKWVSQLYAKLYPWCLEPPFCFRPLPHTGHIGGIYERVMAFAVGQEDLKAIRLNVNHDHKYKKAD
jgi:hypothetical protein